VQESTHRLNVDKGIDVTYRLLRATEAQRPVVVLLHGLASNLTRWSEFLEHTTLKDAWDILRVDLRGHGRSLYRCKLSMEIWCQDLLRTLDAERYANAVLVGHSLGAQLAIHFAHRHPTRVRGLVLIDPILGRPSKRMVRLGQTLRPILRLATAGIRLLNRLGLRRRHIPERDLRALDERTREELLTSGRIEEMVGQYKSPWPDLKHQPTANFLDASTEMVRPLPPLSGITTSVLVVLSRGATYADPDVTRQMIGQFRRATTVVIDAYHWPLTEKPTETRQAIEDWCAGLNGISRSRES
jgi:pimeloyl-ACP methyl ester carboxylesterase